MKQKDYKCGIILSLLQGESHLRSLALAVGTNPMTVSRHARLLVEGNVLDFRQEGRNKVFFVKQTEEGRAYAHMAEHYRLLRLLSAHGDLRRVIRLIQQDRRITLATLFGSYARGEETKESDVDIFVEPADREIKRAIERADQRASVTLGTWGGKHPLIEEIRKDHVIIKGVERFHEESGLLWQAEK